MRAFLALTFLITVLTGFSQNFVSPGIIAYHSGAFERTIQDMNKAFETSPNMENDMRSKAFYYRGMARISLLKEGSSSPFIGPDPYINVYNDLTNAIRLDPQWRESSQAEMPLIYRQLVNRAVALYDQGIYAATEDEVNRLLGSAVIKLNTALSINNNYEVNDLLGKTYDAMGIFYDQLVDDQDAQSKALSSYQSAMRFHESALNINPRSLENIRALKQLAYRLGDRDKEIQYAQMEASIGG